MWPSRSDFVQCEFAVLNYQHEDSGAFAGQGADSINAAQAVGQHRVQGVLLLIVEDGKFTLNKIAARWPAWAVAQFYFSDK